MKYLFFRKKNNRRNRPFGSNTKLPRKTNGNNKLASQEVSLDTFFCFSICGTKSKQADVIYYFQDIPTRMMNKKTEYNRILTERDPMYRREPPQQSVEQEVSHAKNVSQGDIPFSGPLQVSTSSGFAWAKKRVDDSSISHRRSSSRGLTGFVNSSSVTSENECESKILENEVCNESQINGKRFDSSMLSSRVTRPNWKQFGRYDSFDGSDDYHSQDLSMAISRHDEMAKKNYLVSFFFVP